MTTPSSSPPPPPSSTWVAPAAKPVPAHVIRDTVTDAILDGHATSLLFNQCVSTGRAQHAMRLGDAWGWVAPWNVEDHRAAGSDVWLVEVVALD